MIANALRGTKGAFLFMCGGEGGRRKKGVVEKIKEKLPGGDQCADEHKTRATATGGKMEMWERKDMRRRDSGVRLRTSCQEGVTSKSTCLFKLIEYIHKHMYKAYI